MNAQVTQAEFVPDEAFFSRETHHAAAYLASLPAERRAQLEREWDPVVIEAHVDAIEEERGRQSQARCKGELL